MPAIVPDYRGVVQFMHVLLLVLQVTWIVLFAYFIHYFTKLKSSGCLCAVGWRSKAMQMLLIAMIILFVATILLRGRFGLATNYLIIACVLAFVVISYQFVHETRHSHCECAKTRAFRALDIFTIIMMFVFALMLFNVAVNVILTMLMKRSLRRQQQSFTF